MQAPSPGPDRDNDSAFGGPHLGPQRSGRRSSKSATAAGPPGAKTGTGFTSSEGGSSSSDRSDVDDSTTPRRGRGRGPGRGRGRGGGRRGGGRANQQLRAALATEIILRDDKLAGEEVFVGDMDTLDDLLPRLEDAPGAPVSVLIDRSGDRPLEIPGLVFADIVAAYNILRSFSWQLKLSPFSLVDLCSALCCPQPCELLDELHVCVLRTLASHETSAARRRRLLDLEHLDQVTWPEFVWEWLGLVGERILTKHRAQAAPQPLHLQPVGAPALGGAGAAAASAAAGDQPMEDVEPQQPGGQAAAGAGAGARGLEEAAAAAADTRDVQWEQVAGGARRPGGPSYSAPGLAAALRRRRPHRSVLRSEFYNLPLACKAALLARLCDDLLEAPGIRAEINRREAAGQMHAGRGGEGGAWPQFSAAELAVRERQVQAGAFEDGNTESCVLCGLGGSLLCCDRCPAAYHMRCVGESSRSIPHGEWRCPECVIGSKGEAAGLRVPMAGISPATGCPSWVAYGCVFAAHCEARPPAAAGAPVGDVGFRGLQLLLGPEAQRHAEMLRRPRRLVDDVPHPTSELVLLGGPAAGCMAERGEAAAYDNRYRPAWEMFVQAMKAAHDIEYKKSKRAGATPASALAVPLPLPAYSWPQLQEAPRRSSAPRGGPDGSSSSAAASELCGRLAVLQRYLLATERELWGLLEGGWGRPGEAGKQWRRQWAAAVRAAASPAQLAPRFLELEAALRRSLPVFSPQWDPYRRDPAELARLELMVAERQRDAESYRRRRITSLLPQPKKGPGRPPRKKIPPHLQAWNDLRSAQAAAARATSVAPEAAGGATPEGPGGEGEEAGQPWELSSQGVDEDAGAADNTASTSPPGKGAPPESQSQSQPPSQSQGRQPRAGAGEAAADMEAEAGAGGRSARRRSKAASGVAAGGSGGGSQPSGAPEGGQAAERQAELELLGAMAAEEVVLDKWWRDLLASFGEVDAVDLLGAALAAGGELGPLPGPERRAALRKARTGWSWWRPAALRAEAELMLPREQARKLARRGGKTLIKQGVIYHTTLRHTLSRRLAWVATTEHATSVAQLAVQARVFEDALQWERIRRPALTGAEGAADVAAAVPPEYLPYTHSVALAKRVVGPERRVEYLLAPDAVGQALLQSGGSRHQPPPPQQQQQLNGLRMLTPDAGVSQWVAEGSVPLWLLRAYEERVRAGEPTHQRGAPALPPAGAADSPASACLVCGLTPAESAGTPLAAGGWVGCATAFGTCLTGCHAACVGVPRRELELPGGRGKWLCTRCAGEALLQRQAAVDKYVSRRVGTGGASAVVLTPQQLLEQALAEATAVAAGVDPEGADEALLLASMQ
ncbi:hypothetical protein Agub_g11157, partial [Astrephomene gubernaculifera]